MAREYKDSGIEWIGQIPKEWKVSRIKTIFSERTELSENGDETLLSVSEYYGVANRKEKIEDGDFVSRAESLVGYKKCYKGDLVSNIMLAWKGSLGVTDIDGIVSPAYCVYQPSKEVFPHYYHYLFRTSLFTSIFRLYSKGIIDSRLRLYSPFFFAISTLIPPFSEQQKIADYLDKVCGEVDEMVTLQETMIEELKAYKQSVITEAVTKGLNPNAPMRDSGIDWIGEIPEHWKVSRLKYFSIFINGFAFSSDVFTMGIGCKVIRIGDISRSLDLDGCVRANIKTDALQSYRIKNNDIVIAMSGATTGKCCIAKDVDEAYINQRVGIIRCDNYSYVYYSLQTDYFLEYINLNNAGSAQPNVSGVSIGNFPLLVPSLDEQQSIASYLDTKCVEIDDLIAIKESKIEELKDYKKSVIYEYVTGKKEVV